MEPKKTKPEDEQKEAAVDKAEGTAPAEDATSEKAASGEKDSHEPTLAEIGAEENEKIKAEKQELPKKPKKKVSLGITIAIAVIVAIVCGYAGYAASGPINAAAHSSSATLSSDQLGNVIATYISDGTTVNITAGDVITGMGTAANSDGSYPAPGASTIASYAQNKVVSDEADKRGITVSDDETKAYAESQMGSSDYDNIGKSYGLSGEQVKQMLAQSVKTNKLVNQVVGFDTTTPTAPKDPGKSKRGDKTADFASYITDLLTKAGVWDSSAGTWSNTDNEYYKDLGEDFDGKTASYAQANKVYKAYNKSYQEKMQQASTDWQNFTNGLYSKMQLTVYGVYSS